VMGVDSQAAAFHDALRAKFGTVQRQQVAAIAPPAQPPMEWPPAQVFRRFSPVPLSSSTTSPDQSSFRSAAEEQEHASEDGEPLISVLVDQTERLNLHEPEPVRRTESLHLQQDQRRGPFNPTQRQTTALTAQRRYRATAPATTATGGKSRGASNRRDLGYTEVMRASHYVAGSYGEGYSSSSASSASSAGNGSWRQPNAWCARRSGPTRSSSSSSSSTRRYASTSVHAATTAMPPQGGHRVLTRSGVAPRTCATRY